jgi:fatty-acyl-CoA synthase
VTAPAAIDVRREVLRRRFAVWQPRTLSNWLDNCAERYRDRPLVFAHDRELTYEGIAAESRRLADGLATIGVHPGDRVAMVMANYAEFVAIKFAIARAGAIAVPLNYLYRSEELRLVLADSGCRVVIAMTGFADLDYQAMLDDMPDAPTIVLLDTDGRARPGVLTVQGLAALGDRNPGASDGRAVDPCGPGDMLYTSGTTGSAKGVLVSHDAVLRTAFASALTRAYEEGRGLCSRCRATTCSATSKACCQSPSLAAQSSRRPRSPPRATSPAFSGTGPPTSYACPRWRWR